jgi:prefoldin subunit 5
MTNSEYQQLVEFLGRQFAEIDRRFAAVDQRFVAMDQRFVAMEERFQARFETIETQLRDVLAHFDQLYLRLERLEQEYHVILQALRRIEILLVDEKGGREVLERSVEELKHQVAALQTRIAELEQRIRG